MEGAIILSLMHCIIFLETIGESGLFSCSKSQLRNNTLSPATDSERSQYILLFYPRTYKICISLTYLCGFRSEQALFGICIYNFAYKLLILLTRSFCFVVMWAMENFYEPGKFINVYVLKNFWVNALQVTVTKN